MERVESYEEAKSRLVELAEDKYRDFSAKLTLTERPFLGVRIPVVRELAGAVASSKIREFYYADFNYLAVIFDRVEKLAGREEYYIRMAIAWLVAECFIKYPEKTLAYMRVSGLSKWTYNKTISKICDSYRVDVETKEMLKKMRK